MDAGVVDWVVLVLGAAIALAGAVGVIVARNPVHSALFLVLTLFGVAVLFVAQEAHFLAAVQVIVYAGAVVVLFLFVIMLLGVDRAEDMRTEQLKGQRQAAAVVGVAALALLGVLTRFHFVLGEKSVSGTASGDEPNVAKIGSVVFTRYLVAFEITSILLVIAVVGAVVLSRRPPPAPATSEGERAAA